jgi:arylformamidase
MGNVILSKPEILWKRRLIFDFVFLNEDGADYLAKLVVRGIGTNAFCIERNQPGHPTQKTLFANGVIIIEGLRLKEVEAGEYFMVAAPLKLMVTDISPSRVLLFVSLRELGKCFPSSPLYICSATVH